MIYRHIRNGDLYRVLFDTWSVERQQREVAYMSMTTGVVFTRGTEKFKENFALVEEDTFTSIQPREPHV